MPAAPVMSALPISIRPVEDRDGAPVAALIAACFAEYEGCLYEPSEFPELAAPASWYAPKGTLMWVAVQGGPIVGCICATPASDAMELHKFYVAQHLRGSGLALRLTDLFFDAGRAAGAARAFLWTDTRFTRAHRFYEKLGFVRGAATRQLHDVSDTTEFFYEMALPPVRA
jgi:putative acetyltransferase